MLFKSQRNPRRSGAVKGKTGACGSPLQITRWMGAGNVERLRATLSEAGVELTGSHTGRLLDEHFVADVHLEPDDVIHVRCAIDLRDEPYNLLRRFSGVAGSIRCGLGIHGLHLAAETRVDGVAHLPHSLKEIREGFSLAFQQRAAVADGGDSVEGDAASVRAAIEHAGWLPEEIVETTEGYELQPRLDGSRIAVQVVPQSGAALVRRTVLPVLPAGNACGAVAHQALVWNARLRCCRLAISGGRLDVESRLPAQRIDAEWLSFTVRGVAAAAHSVEPELELLASDPDVARAYADMFGITPAPEPDN